MPEMDHHYIIMIIATEYLQVCCRVTYRMRKLKNMYKGAILVLVWSFLAMSVYGYLFDTVLPSYNDLVIYSVLAIIGVMLAINCWLAS